MPNRALPAVGLTVLAFAAGPVAPRQPTASERLVGTWQLMTSLNVATGEMDSVANHTVVWIIYAPTRMSATFMRRDRSGGMSPADFAKLSPAEKARIYHSWAWTDDNKMLFGGLASAWRLSGNTISYASEMRLNPYRVGRSFTETIVRLDDSTLVIRSNVTGVLREESSRRLQ